MNDLDTEFFQGKRPWSRIKDQVLGGYITPYLAKVAKLGRPILLIDGYAGPGTFAEDGSFGSPLIMCDAAEKYAPQSYRALFVNHNKAHHASLEKTLIDRGLIERATPILGDSTVFLNRLSQQLQNQTVFVYLDPFGLKGCEFSTLKPFLTRYKAYSTELVLNVSMPVTHRLAAANQVARGSATDPRITSYHQRMTDVFGGDYWKDIYFSELGAEEKEVALIKQYQSKIAQDLPFTGSCPVRESSTSRIKYFIVFASRHPDAMLLMNDEMCKAYFGQMHQAAYAGTLFGHTNWQDFRTLSHLEQVIQVEIAASPGQKRQELWLSIVQKHFMQFTKSEFIQAINELSKKGQIRVEYTPTKRLNDDCRIYSLR